MNDKVITEEERIKAIPGKELAASIKSMNEYLVSKDLEIIVTEGTTKAQAIENLLSPILTAIENDDAPNLPEDVIAFYNDHLVGAAPEEVEPEVEAPKAKKGKKEPKAKKEPKEKAPKKVSNEENTYNMVKAGKTDEEIHTHFKGVYTGKEDAFIAKRAAIYTNIAKRKYASENADFKAKWDAEKEAAKPVKPVKEKVVTKAEGAAETGTKTEVKEKTVKTTGKKAAPKVKK